MASIESSRVYFIGIADPLWLYVNSLCCHAARSSLYTSFVGWISGHASTEYDRVRLVYKLDECRTRCYVLVDALALIHPTRLRAWSKIASAILKYIVPTLCVGTIK